MNKKEVHRALRHTFMRSKSSTVLLTQKALLKPLALVWGD